MSQTCSGFHGSHVPIEVGFLLIFVIIQGIQDIILGALQNLLIQSGCQRASWNRVATIAAMELFGLVEKSNTLFMTREFCRSHLIETSCLI